MEDTMVISVDGNDINLGDFVGKFWTHRFHDMGCDQVIIKYGNEEILIDWNLPETRYGNEESKVIFEEYIRKRGEEGWQFCASWGYGYFKKK